MGNPRPRTMAEREEGVNIEIDTPDFHSAKCIGLKDKDFFFPRAGKQEAERLPQLRAICSSCTHERECLSFALDKQIVYGFWGGKSPLEREAIIDRKTNRVAVKGVALQIKNLRQAGQSVREIAASLGAGKYYVWRVFRRLDAANNKGAVQSIKQTENSSEGSWS